MTSSEKLGIMQPGPPGTQPRWYTTFCLGCCPCCVPPCFTAARQEGCWRVAKTAAFALSLIQVAVFIASLCIRGFAPLAINSGFGPWGDTLDWMGAKNAYKILNGDIVNYFHRDSTGTIDGPTTLAERAFSGPQPWRLFTNIFLHSGVIHIVLNLVLQLRLALHAEVVWGMWRFLPLYMASGISGALWSAVINPTQLSVGASGALLGVVGAWFVFLLCHYWHGDAAEQVRRGGAVGGSRRRQPRTLPRLPLHSPLTGQAPPPFPPPHTYTHYPPSRCPCCRACASSS